MKQIKNKEIIIGLIALIVLLIMAIILILRRETSEETKQKEYVAVEEVPIAEKDVTMDISEASSETVNKQEAVSDIVVAENLAIEPLPQVSGNSIRYDDSMQYHSNPVYKEYTGEEMWQLEEIYAYWDQYKLDAVDDLIHLPRVRTITNELKGTNYFYYCGEKDSKGNPNGKGLAVYADNAYYFGDWKNGKRSGRGMYWKTFPDKTASINGATGILEHQYSGRWSNDYPNGEGQEHFTFDYSLASGEYAIANVIGNFEDGYYDGELYIMTVVGDDQFIDWIADAERGTFLNLDKYSEDQDGKKVWRRYYTTEDENKNYRRMYDKDNKGFGIYGLKMKD